MTPLEKAQQLLDDLNTYATAQSVTLPTLQFTKYSVVTPVVTCASVISAIIDLSLVGDEYTPQCNPIQQGTFLLIITRDCAVEFHDDGTDNPAAIAPIAATMDDDTQLLWDFLTQYLPYTTKTWNVTWNVEGGLAITSARLVTGID